MNKRSTKAYEVLADRIISALDAGEVPWRKPWSLQPGMNPQSVNGRAYNGINAVVLGLAGHSDPRWLTYRKAVEMGGHVRHGERSTPVVPWRPIKREAEDADGETEVKTFWLLKYYSVFNVQQCDGLEIPPIDTPKPFDAIEAAKRIFADMPHRLQMGHDGGDRAYSAPLSDEVHLPIRAAFDGAGEYYPTAFHELGNSTGQPATLGRFENTARIAPFGSPDHSREELTAEFAAAFICHDSGIDNTIENSAAYVQSWAWALRKDKRLVVTAASQGQKAADYILGIDSRRPQGKPLYGAPGAAQPIFQRQESTMKVTTVSASARFSKALGDGTHTTIELSAEAAVGEQENWREAQAWLYQELGQQQRALWPTRANGQPTNGNASNGNGRTDAMSEHYCQEHGVAFKPCEKNGTARYSHKASDKWCNER